MRAEVTEAVSAATELGDRHAQELTTFVDGVTELQPNEAMLILGTYMNRIQEGLKIDALSAQSAISAMENMSEERGVV
jgi:hypothetical protein